MMANALDALFAFFFKYRPYVFQRGALSFTSPLPVTLLVLLGLAAIGAAVFLYLRNSSLSTRDRIVLVALRSGAVAALVVALAGPVLLIATVVPHQNYLAILLDDSRSMRIADKPGVTRGAIESRTLDPDSGSLTRALGGRFKLRFFRFSENAQRIAHGTDLGQAGRLTDLATALDAAQREMTGAPMAGIVVATDGADNAGAPMEDVLARLRASRLPVYTLGLGDEEPARDIEVQRAETPRSVLRGSAVVMRVWVSHPGFSRWTIPLVVEDEGRIVTTKEVHLPAGGDPVAVRVSFVATESGPRRFRFRVPVQEHEQVAANNVAEALIDVVDRREKILYFEGEPRQEIGFVRRAIAGDDNLHVVTLVRTTEGKYLRLDVDDSTEVAAGFPHTRDELYRYRGIILGSVEASAFTPEQLRLIADFVNRRGGGLLALGGPRAFGEGGWAETPVAEALPVTIAAPREGSHFFAGERLVPTPAGRDHPVTQIRGSPDASFARWDSLPSLSTVNPITAVKLGASILLTGRSDTAGGPFVALATQRFGRGRAVAFAVQDAWEYRMDASMPVDDRTHETLWRQLLRWLVSDVPDPVAVTTSADRVLPGRPIKITATVSDSAWSPVEGADVAATVVDGIGAERRVQLVYAASGGGEYRASFTPQSEGLHEVRVEAKRGAATIGTGHAWFESSDIGAENFASGRRSALLRRIASETGGRYYTPETSGTLPEDVSLTESGVTMREPRDLWNMPILFFVFIVCAGSEWIYRRSRGLA